MTYSSLLEDKKTIYDPVNIYIGYTGSYSGWYIWKKPNNISLVSIIAVGGGGGGGGGGSIDYGTTGGCGGGGGGGAGYTVTSLFPAIMLPDYLYIFPGTGGGGGLGQVNSISTGTNGQNGGTTYVSVEPSTDRYSAFITASGGQGGFAAVTGRRGSAAIFTPQVYINCMFATLGIFSATAPAASGDPGYGNGVNPSAVNALGNNYNIKVNHPGGGGGGVGLSSTSGDLNRSAVGYGCPSFSLVSQNFHGHVSSSSLATGISASGRCSSIPSGVTDGGNGFIYNYINQSTLSYAPNKFFALPGGGGGGSLAGYTGNGGNGGDGSLSCGGGGGGATLGGAGYAGGNGGNGGPGFVLITTM